MIPTKEFLSEQPEVANVNLEVCTDGSKISERVGYGDLNNGSDIELSFRLPDRCSVFQVDIMEILKAAQYFLGGGIFLVISLDKQAVIVVSTSVLVHEC